MARHATRTVLYRRVDPAAYESPSARRIKSARDALIRLLAERIVAQALAEDRQAHEEASALTEEVAAGGRMDANFR